MKQHDTTSLSIADQTNKKNIICIDVLVGRDGLGHQAWKADEITDLVTGIKSVAGAMVCK